MKQLFIGILLVSLSILQVFAQRMYDGSGRQTQPGAKESLV